MTPNYRSKPMGKRGKKQDPTAEHLEPETEPDQPEEQLPPADEPADPVGDPAAEEEQPEGSEDDEGAEEGDEEPEEEQAAAEPGPLTKLQDAVRALFDHDQLSELRLALGARREDLKRHEKKGVELGVSEPDARHRLEILDGTTTKFGLIRIFDRIQASETRDMFYDREKPNGRPSAKDPSLEETQFSFRTVDGRDVHCTGAQLRLAHIVMDLRAMRVAGSLPEAIEVAFREMGYWHLLEDATPADERTDDAEAAALAAETGAVVEESAGAGA